MALYSLAVNDICLVTFRGRLNGQTILNTFHYKYVPPSGTTYPDGPAAVRQLGIAVKTTIWGTAWNAAVSANYTLDAVQAQVVYPTRRVFEWIVVNEQGAMAGDTLPPANQVCITRYGSLPGRGRSASLQIAGAVATQVSLGYITPAAETAFSAIANLIPNKLPDPTPEADAWVPVNWTLPKAAEFNPIRTADVHVEIRTEKRRVVGRGI